MLEINRLSELEITCGVNTVVMQATVILARRWHEAAQAPIRLSL